jgi:hypothetical protein
MLISKTRRVSVWALADAGCLPFWDVIAGDKYCYNLGSCTYYLGLSTIPIVSSVATVVTDAF